MRETFSHKMRIKSEIVVLGHFAILASNACVAYSGYHPSQEERRRPHDILSSSCHGHMPRKRHSTIAQVENGGLLIRPLIGQIWPTVAACEENSDLVGEAEDDSE